MHMTFEKVDPPEHPAIVAAKTIRQMHVETIAQMDEGHVYTKDGVSVNDQMREACLAQIARCDELIATAKDRPAVLDAIQPLVFDAQAVIVEELGKAASEETLPEIGNYDHKNE